VFPDNVATVFQAGGAVINALGAFFYAPSGGYGNLVGSITTGSGLDQYGNAYLAGSVNYENLGGTFYAQQSTIGIQFYVAASAGGPWVLETWVNTSLPSPATAGYIARYMLLSGTTTVRVQVGSNWLPGIGPGTIALFTLPPEYIPSQTQRGGCGIFTANTSGTNIANTRWNVAGGTGAVSLLGCPSNTTETDFTADISLN
jgi:hypothetical protein